MALTKTSFMRGMQCEKMLWLDKHKPKLQEIPETIQERIDAGNDFGDRAMGLFGPYEEMTVYRPGTTIPNTKAMMENTKKHLEAGTPVICEAAFSNYNNYCAVDILRKTEDGYDMYEVKNAPAVTEQFLKDAGYQYFVIKRCQVNIGKIFLILHGPDEENPFVIEDITKEAKGYYKWVNDHIWNLNRMQKEAEEIQREPGEQCLSPYECWYYSYCHQGELSPTRKKEMGIEEETL